MEYTPRFVTSEEFLNYWGVDLNSRLVGYDNKSNKADIFLRRVEDRLMAWIDSNTYRDVPYESLQGKQLEAWKLAILTQANYIFSNNEIMLDSGYDPEKGIVASRSDLEKIEICQAAIDYIKVAGLYNLCVSNKNRYLYYR